MSAAPDAGTRPEGRSEGRSEGRPEGGRSGALSAADFSVIADFVLARSGIVLGLDKAYLVESRLDPIVRARGLAGLTEIAARLRGRPDDALARDVVDAMTTNETLFFRDARPFEHLGRQVLPALHAAHPPPRPLRIWSAASSSGQEPYSIAMTALDFHAGDAGAGVAGLKAAGPASRTVRILATDISDAQLERARRGVYSAFEVQRGLSPALLAKYFHRVEAGWRIAEPVRELVEFRRWNLLDDPRPLGDFDVVFCRNVLIYFDLPMKRQVLGAIWERLAPGGLLYLGGAETIFGVSDRFVPCPGLHHVYMAVAR